MDEDSKKIRGFIKQIQKGKNKHHPKNQKKNEQKKNEQKRTSFSEESRIFIEKIFHYMKQGSLIKHKMSTTNLEELPTGNHFHLLEQDVKDKIENQIKIYKKTVFQVGDRTFDIYMCFQDGSSFMKKMDVWLQYMYIWFYVASHFAVPSCSKHLSVYLYYTDLKKMVPEIDGQTLEADNANTAFTFACKMPGNNDNKNEIYIYRLEEWFKVFLHETFHSFGLDFATMDQTAVQTRICVGGDIYNVPCNDLRFYESYTETWAEIMQCMFSVFAENKIKDDDTNSDEDNDSVGKLEELIYGYEAPFSAFQAAKVLDHFGLSYDDLFDKDAASQYNETTPVFSYYIIKSVFMNHADEFIRWNMEHNRGSLQFKKTASNINQLVDVLKSLCKNDDYMKEMDRMDQLLEMRMDIMLATTMRMSCISFL